MVIIVKLTIVPGYRGVQRIFSLERPLSSLFVLMSKFMLELSTTYRMIEGRYDEIT
jgi:hypothetical protein